MKVSLFLTLLLLAGADPATARDRYADDVKPLFKERCWACHGGLKQEGSLRLDTASSIRKGGDSGKAVVPGDPLQSVLIERITAKDASRMPPEGEPLTPEEIAHIREWISAGAIGIENEQPEKDPRDHWAFRTPQRPQLPKIEGLPSDANPIDAFILSRLKHERLPPRPIADKPTRLRRAYLDVIGVPPTREELHAFVKDNSPDAWERVVDSLLDDSRYGERWARHWMDVWRYSDWYGRRHVPDVWNSAPQVWRWRDWIVSSLNNDKGYDRMVAEMLAADEIAPEDREAGYATGFLVRNWYALNPNDWMRANVEHTGKAFLGLTFNCAHCHDHKYDPITHDEYFQLRAFFEPIYIRQDRAPGEPDPGPFQDYNYSQLRKIQPLGSVRIFDKHPDAKTWFYTGGDERNRVESCGSIPPGFPKFLPHAEPKIEEIQLPPRGWYAGLLPEIQKTVVNEVKASLADAQAKLAEVRKTPQKIDPEAKQKLAMAEAEFATAIEAALPTPKSGALVGKYSLLVDATKGRRFLHNCSHVQELQSLPDDARIELQVKLLTDTYFNFQLTREMAGGLTASVVAFTGDRIVAYRPGGGFNEFEVGNYDFAAGQNHFQISIVIEPSTDRCLLTVRSVSNDVILVDRVPIALNGWNPIGDDTKAITFDARTGCVALVDEITLTAPASDDLSSDEEELFRIDFESGQYADGQDIIGVDGWVDSAWSVAPATSYVSSTGGDAKLRELKRKVEAAELLVKRAMLPVHAAEARVQAAAGMVASVEARIAADKVRYGENPDAEVLTHARAASLAEREATHAKAKADALENELALSKAEAQPMDAKDRTKQIETAESAFAKARAEVKKSADALRKNAGSDRYSPLSAQYPKTSTGRRRALAQWLTDRENPLTARVAVNHIWMRHFHAPLVSTVHDFGRNGASPTHPQLLDWLAVELMESGWSMKHIHRQILTSDAWQRVSSVGDDTKNAQSDPENKLLWRMNSGRMEAEVLRDSLLYCGGKLDTTMGGPTLENTTALTTFRRSLYYSVFPEDGGAGPLSELFDAPNPLDCYRRTRSIVPQQALALTNSELVHQMAALITGQTGELPEDDFIVRVFEKLLSRAPSEFELSVCKQALAEQRTIRQSEGAQTPETDARESLVRALLNHNDFITIR